jgi:hypothetical protein
MAFPQKKSTSSDFRCVSHLLRSKLGLLAYPLDNVARTGASCNERCKSRSKCTKPCTLWNIVCVLWNVVMEHCVRLFDKDEAKHRRGDTQLSLTATIFYEATEEDHDARSTHPFEGLESPPRHGLESPRLRSQRR